jgi:hypothetical protein
MISILQIKKKILSIAIFLKIYSHSNHNKIFYLNCNIYYQAKVHYYFEHSKNFYLQFYLHQDLFHYFMNLKIAQFQNFKHHILMISLRGQNTLNYLFRYQLKKSLMEAFI